MKEVIKTGILGFGKQGSHYARRFLEGNLCPELRFSAIAETDREKRDWAKDHLPPDVKIFDSERSMLDSGSIDACIIATPHILHPEEQPRRLPGHVDGRMPCHPDLPSIHVELLSIRVVGPV